MRTLRAWLVRVIGFMRPRHGEQEFADELQSHIELHVADNVRAGMTPDEARRRALASVAGVLLAVALVAAAIPASRVMRVDPVSTLRSD